MLAGGDAGAGSERLADDDAGVVDGVGNAGRSAERAQVGGGSRAAEDDGVLALNGGGRRPADDFAKGVQAVSGAEGAAEFSEDGDLPFGDHEGALRGGVERKRGAGDAAVVLDLKRGGYDERGGEEVVQERDGVLR